MPAMSRIALALLALGITAGDASARSHSSSAIVLTDQSANWVTKAYVGQPVEIRLKSQAGTGYSWVPTKSSWLVKEMPTVKPSRMLPGGSQVQRFRFKAKKRGLYVVGFSYGQPWKGGAKGAKTRSFMIKVR